MRVYKGKVRLIIKNYPYKYRDYAFIAAEASLAARDQGKYWEMHDLLLARSPRLDRDNLILYAKEIGLDVQKFIDSIDKKSHSREIEDDIRLALKIDLYTTPILFLSMAERSWATDLSSISKR